MTNYILRLPFTEGQLTAKLMAMSQSEYRRYYNDILSRCEDFSRKTDDVCTVIPLDKNDRHEYDLQCVALRNTLYSLKTYPALAKDSAGIVAKAEMRLECIDLLLEERSALARHE